jgi:hypothetical protein
VLHVANFLLIVGLSALVIGVALAYFGDDSSPRTNTPERNSGNRRTVESRPATRVARGTASSVKTPAPVPSVLEKSEVSSGEFATTEEPLHSDVPEVKAAMNYATELADTDTQRVVSLLRRWLREDGEWHER